MTRVTFLLSKDPMTVHAGDIELSRVAMRLAADAFDVSAICLSDEPGQVTANLVPNGLPLTRIIKPRVQKPKILAASLFKRRSLAHVRYDFDELVATINEADGDVFVAEHSYMAESFLRSEQFGKVCLVINTMNTESQVWRATRAPSVALKNPGCCEMRSGPRRPPMRSERTRSRKPRCTAPTDNPARDGST